MVTAKQWAGGVCWAVLAALALCGCSSYHLGPSTGQAAGARSIQVNPFMNQTLEPRLGDAVTSALRQNLQRDGTYRLTTQGVGDVTVTGSITHYDRSSISYNPKDVLTVLDYRLLVTAHVTAHERSTGKTLLDRDVTGYTLVRPGTDLTSAERQALPLLAENLAKSISSILVDGAW